MTPVISGALLALAGLVNLAIADGRTARVALALFVVVTAVVVMAGGVRAYRRQRR